MHNTMYALCGVIIWDTYLVADNIKWTEAILTIHSGGGAGTSTGTGTGTHIVSICYWKDENENTYGMNGPQGTAWNGGEVVVAVVKGCLILAYIFRHTPQTLSVWRGNQARWIAHSPRGDKFSVHSKVKLRFIMGISWEIHLWFFFTYLFLRCCSLSHWLLSWATWTSLQLTLISSNTSK